MLTIVNHVCGPLDNNVYLLVNEATRDCAVVDPGMETEPVLAYIAEHGLNVRAILLTHAHFDHIYSLAEFQNRFSVPTYMHPDDLPLVRRLNDTLASWGMPPVEQPREPEVQLAHNTSIEVCGTTIEVRHTPGHSPGQVAFIFEGNCVSGDTLFWRGVGRWDLPGADWATLEQSIIEQLYTLPDETRVLPGHMQETTIGAERRHNPYVGAGKRFIPKV